MGDERAQHHNFTISGDSRWWNRSEVGAISHSLGLFSLGVGLGSWGIGACRDFIYAGVFPPLIAELFLTLWKLFFLAMEKSRF
jgi:hypothetical protein